MTPGRTAPPVPEETEIWRLRDRRQFLHRSLADAAREHEAGDLSSADYAALRRRDEAALSFVERRLERLASLPGEPEEHAGTRPPEADRAGERPAARSRRRRRWWMVAVGVAALLAGAVILVLGLMSPRLAGQTSSGGIQLDPGQQVTQYLDQAAVAVRQGHEVQAIALYRQVLAIDAKQPEALAEWGWLTWQAARRDGTASLEARAEASVTEAATVQPDFAAAHLYLGTMRLETDGDPAGAVAQYRQFLAENPSPSEVSLAAPFLRRAFAAAGQPLPAGVPAS